MSWLLDNAVKRVFNAFKRNKNGIYTEDIEALKLINTAIENTSKAYVNDNLLYAKLLSIILHQNLVHYSDINFAIKKIGSDLELPLNYHLQFLHKDLNSIELQRYFRSIGVKEWKTEAELLENNVILKENQKEVIEKLKFAWTFENVEKSFYNTANTFLKDTNNYL